jgi:hypothetical protein
MTAGDSVTGRGATIAVLNPAGSHQRTNRGVARVYIIPDSRVPQVPNVGIVWWAASSSF